MRSDEPIIKMLTAGAIAAVGLGVAAVSAAGAMGSGRPLAGKSGTQLIGNELGKVPPFYFATGGNVPFIVDLCCSDLERRKKTNADINWIDSFTQADPANVEKEALLRMTIKNFCDNSRKQKKTKVKPLTTVQVIELLLYYLVTLPDPLCGGENFDLFREVHHKHSQTSDTSAWIAALCDGIIQLPNKNRMTMTRILEMNHVVVQDESDKLADLLTERFSPVIFSEPYPVIEEEIESPEEGESEEKAKDNEEAPPEPEKKSRLRRLFKRSNDEVNETLHNQLHNPEGEHLASSYKVLITKFDEADAILKEHPISRRK